MGLAYCSLAHKNPAQIARLLRAIAHPDNVCVVHYEKRAPRSEPTALARKAHDFANVHILPSRPVLWGRYSVIGTQLEGLKQCLALGDRWSHFITLSGQDMPLKPQAEMVAELAAAQGTSFASYFDPVVEPHWKNLADRTSRVPSWFRYMGGSNHVILAREAASYLVSDPKALRITQWLKYSGIPDESIFQSVLLNSPLAASVVNDDRRAICWESHGSPSPITFTRSQLAWLREARAQGKLFARKFDSGVDDEVICAIAKDLGL